MATFDEIKALKKRHSAQLLKMGGVCGVDIDSDDAGQAVLTVHLDTSDPAVRQQLPIQLEGYPVRYVHTGPFRKE
jgi:hypothetical protein